MGGPLSKKQIYLESLHQQKERVELYLNTLRNGQIPNVGPLEQDITVLCKNIGQLKPEEAREAEQDLRTLLLLVEEFVRELEDTQDSLKTKLESE
tara:strand:+ start:118 stop:402 length:285 start_codon:yes stop_codon:yes gene_type:complete